MVVEKGSGKKWLHLLTSTAVLFSRWFKNKAAAAARSEPVRRRSVGGTPGGNQPAFAHRQRRWTKTDLGSMKRRSTSGRDGPVGAPTVSCCERCVAPRARRAESCRNWIRTRGRVKSRLLSEKAVRDPKQRPNRSNVKWIKRREKSFRVQQDPQGPLTPTEHVQTSRRVLFFRGAAMIISPAT